MVENGLEESGKGTEEKKEEPYAESGRTMPGTPREAAQTPLYCQVGACKTAARKAQHAVMADAARCEGACSALHRPSHRSAFYRPAACSPPHGEFRPRPPHADLCRESPTEAVLGTAPFHPKRHPDTRQNPRWFQGNAPQHGREGSPPTPFEHKCMKRRKFPLPLQGETICLGTR